MCPPADANLRYDIYYCLFAGLRRRADTWVRPYSRRFFGLVYFVEFTFKTYLNPLPTTLYPLPTTHYLLPTTFSPLPSKHFSTLYPLPSKHFSTHYLLPSTFPQKKVTEKTIPVTSFILINHMSYALYSCQLFILMSSRRIEQMASTKALARRTLVMSGMLWSMAPRRMR